MKIKLLALSCLAALGMSAQAADVQLYGAVDTYVAVNNIGGEWATGIQSGGTTASHWGIKGTEDLGNGMEAFFNLDQAFLVDNGQTTLGSDGMAFSREANLGIRGKWGSLSFGRQYTPHFLVFAMSDPTKLSLGSSFSPYFFPGPASVTGQDGSLVRADNSVLYVLPTPFGLTNFFFVALGETGAGSNTKGNIYNYMGKFDYGKFTFMASYLYRSMPTNSLMGYHEESPWKTASRYHNNFVNLAAIYDFGVTKPVINFTYKNASGDREKTFSDDFWLLQVGTSTPLWGGDWQISGSYLRNLSYDHANAWSLGTKYNYPLSKRTQLYVGVEAVWNGDNAGYAIEAGPDSSTHFGFDQTKMFTGYGTSYTGKNVQQFFVGINHQF